MKTIPEVYAEIMRSAQYMKETGTSEASRLIANNLYWVASLLEDTKELNPELVESKITE